MEARRRRDSQTVHVRRFSRSDCVRESARAGGRGRRSSPGHPDQLQARDADVFDSQRRRADGEGLRRCGRRRSCGSSAVKLKKTYSSREVAALTGLTARQLQLWDASGLVSPAIAPRRTAAGGYTERRYTPIDLFELLVLADLRRRGFSIPHLHRIVRILKEQFGTRLFDATGGGSGVQLLTDGREVYARTDRGEFFN